jgi:hypothetical protein
MVLPTGELRKSGRKVLMPAQDSSPSQFGRTVRQNLNHMAAGAVKFLCMMRSSTIALYLPMVGILARCVVRTEAQKAAWDNGYRLGRPWSRAADRRVRAKAGELRRPALALTSGSERTRLGTGLNRCQVPARRANRFRQT